MFRLRKLMIVLFLTSLVACSQKKTKVTGDIKGLEATELIFSYTVADSSKIDTVEVKDGKFVWEAEFTEPKRVYIMFPNRYVEFFADKGDIQLIGVADSLQNLQITGSKTQDEAIAYKNSLEDLNSQRSPLYQKYDKVSKEEQLELEEKLNELRLQQRARAKEYIAKNPSSAFSVSLVEDRALMGEYEDVEEIYNLLTPSAQKTNAGKQLAERLDVLKRSRIGESMWEFTQNNAEGNPVQFADFKGKYVLVDFWASWCGPCRAENPNVLKAYNKYKDKNFTVLGVSLDDDGDKWKKAIEEDGMPWTQVSDLKGSKNEVSTYYGIRAIPSTLLVDPDGKIIAKDLGGEILNKKLSELFD